MTTVNLPNLDAKPSDCPEGKMRSALFYEPNKVAYELVDLPEPGPGEVIMAVDTALSCGTDVKCYRRGHPVLLKNFPAPFGHECAGVVSKVGEGVEQFEPGDRIVAANSAPCYQCFYCKKGKTNLCEELDLLNGAYADFIRIPARIVKHNTHIVPDHVSLQAAAFCEPLSVCLRGVELSQVSSTDRVAIIGLGPIGQLLVKSAKWKNAHVTGFARTQLKLDTAVNFGGADAVINLRENNDVENILKEYTPDGRGFDVVIEAVGQPETWQMAMELVRKGGTVNLFGGCKAGTTVPLDTRRLHYDEITLLSLFHHTPHFFKKALDLMASQEIDPTPLISTHMPMAEFEKALQMMESGEVLKVALKN